MLDNALSLHLTTLRILLALFRLPLYISLALLHIRLASQPLVTLCLDHYLGM